MKKPISIFQIKTLYQNLWEFQDRFFKIFREIFQGPGTYVVEIIDFDLEPKPTHCKQVIVRVNKNRTIHSKLTPAWIEINFNKTVYCEWWWHGQRIPSEQGKNLRRQLLYKEIMIGENNG
jgi:hypothetical protein